MGEASSEVSCTPKLGSRRQGCNPGGRSRSLGWEGDPELQPFHGAQRNALQINGIQQAQCHAEAMPPKCHRRSTGSQELFPVPCSAVPLFHCSPSRPIPAGCQSREAGDLRSRSPGKKTSVDYSRLRMQGSGGQRAEGESPPSRGGCQAPGSAGRGRNWIV